MEPLIIAILIVAAVLIIIGAALIFLRRMADASEAVVREKYPHVRLIIRGALLFGVESRGVGQMRGNGTLALTDHEVYFRRWAAPTDYHVPLAAITAIETPLAFLGKSSGRRLLKLVFQNADGQPDAIAWYVPNLEATIAALEALRTRGG